MQADNFRGDKCP